MTDAPEDTPEERDIARLLDAKDLRAAAARIVEVYGASILGYLTALLHDEAAADEAYSRFGEELLKGLAGFRRDSSARSWAYRVAWSCGLRISADPLRRRARRLMTQEGSVLPAPVRTSTDAALGAPAREWLERMRATLTPEEQSLLILRIDKDLSWKEVALVLAQEGESVDEAALRKRFDRLKRKLKEAAADAGIVDP